MDADKLKKLEGATGAADKPAENGKPASTSWADVCDDDDEAEIAGKMAKAGVSTGPGADSKEDDDPQPTKLDSLLDPNDDRHEVKVEAIGGNMDPSSHLYSAKTFEELNLSKELLQGVYAMNFNKPSKIQATALPLMLQSPPKNIIGQAHSGSGKTATFSLAMLTRTDPALKHPQCLCVCPTRELARQIYDVISSLGKYLADVKILLLLSDKRYDRGYKIPEQIVISSPGKCKDAMKFRFIDPRGLKMFVLDEADVMMDKQQLGDDTHRIMQMLPPACQRCLFSATFNDRVYAMVEKHIRNANKITVKREELTLDEIKQIMMDCGEGGKDRRYEVLSDIYGCLSLGQTIIFCHTRETARNLKNSLIKDGHTVSLITGGEMTPAERDRVIDEYRAGTTKVLISTNLLARGIDVLQVTLVINYDVPLDKFNKPDAETYIHRIGRTGRFGRKGVAVNFVYDELSRANLKAISDIYKKPITEIKGGDVEELERIIKEQTQ